jgi:hypothetical protein
MALVLDHVDAAFDEIAGQLGDPSSLEGGGDEDAEAGVEV